MATGLRCEARLLVAALRLVVDVVVVVVVVG